MSDSNVHTRVEPLRLSGRLDATSTDALDRLLKAEFDAGAVLLVLDLGAVTYASTSALRSLLLAQRRQQARGGEVVLVNIPARIRRVLTLCGFDRVFDLGLPASN